MTGNMTTPEPPENLSERSRKLWHQIVPERKPSPGWLVLLEEALRALDRADECRRIIADEGLTTKTEATGAVHVHPLAKLERESRAQFMSAWKKLGLAEVREIDDYLLGVSI